MPRSRVNGGVVGVFNEPNGVNAPGVWTLKDNEDYIRYGSLGWPVASNPANVVYATILVVAGGGAGGYGTGGGGGAGGVVYQSNVALSTAYPYKVVVGSGGNPTNQNSTNPGANGGYSAFVGGSGQFFANLVAIGGGAGASSSTPPMQGGSGGGASYQFPTNTRFVYNPGANSVQTTLGTLLGGYGTTGGNGTNFATGAGAGGGGGAGGNGLQSGNTDPGPSGNGGIGFATNIFYGFSNNLLVYYAGGGGGGSYNAASDQPGVGGLGGGGNGAITTGATGGTNGYGGGGGGGGQSNYGGPGGSGTVIISYPGPQVFQGGYTTTYGSNVVHVFTTNTSPFLVANTPANSDPYQLYNSIIIHADSTTPGNNSIFVDSSNAFSTFLGNNYPASLPFPNTFAVHFGSQYTYAMAPPGVFDISTYSTWTYETWFNISSYGTDYRYMMWAASNTGSVNGYYMGYDGSVTNTVSFGTYNNSGSPSFYLNTASNSIKTNTWYHLAIVNNGNTTNNIVMYLNGQRANTGTYTSWPNVGGPTAYLGAEVYNGTEYYLHGFMSNFRITRGVPVYTNNFTPSTVPLTAPNNNVSLLTFQNSNSYQSPNFKDNSINNSLITQGNAGYFNLTLNPKYMAYMVPTINSSGTPTGNPIVVQNQGIGGGFGPVQSPQSPFNNLNGWCTYFSGNGANFLQTTYNSAYFDWWTGGNYCLEAWVLPQPSNTIYYTHYSGAGAPPNIYNPTLIGNMQPQGGTDNWSFGINYNGNVHMYYYNTSSTQQTFSSITPVVPNIWNHIAFVCNSTSGTVYVNGVGAAQSYVGTPQSSGVPLSIGAYNGTYLTNTFVSNLRIQKGGAPVYSGNNFLPPQAALSTNSTTQLLACAANNYNIDLAYKNIITQTGSNNFTINWSPFPPLGTYSNTLGSAAFSGAYAYDCLYLPTVGYLSATSNGTSNTAWSMEAYTYMFNGDGMTICSSYYDSGSRIPFHFGVWNGSPNGVDHVGTYDTKMVYGFSSYNGTGAGQWSSLLSPTQTYPMNSWNHNLVTYDGAVMRLFLNGTLVNSAANVALDANLVWSSSTQLCIGRRWDNNYNWKGNITNFRFVYGSVPPEYNTSTTTAGTSVFTPTWGTLPYNANAVILLAPNNVNFQDATGKNALAYYSYPTGPAANLSNLYAQFGTGSMYSDGSYHQYYGTYYPYYFQPRFTFGRGDYTMEAWIYVTGLHSDYQNIMTTEPNLGQGNRVWFGLDNSATGRLCALTGIGIYGATVPINTWTHVAVCKSNGILRLFQNGIKTAETPDPDDFVTGGNFYVGGSYNGTSSGSSFIGYIDEVRVTQGVARYVNNFVPSSVPFLNT